MRLGGLARLGLVLLAGACSPTFDPLSERCLQALEYREPAHGDIEVTKAHPRPSGAAVAVRYLETTASGTELPRMITCAFEAGERWTFTRITLRGRELSETELALVNAEFLLRDLDHHPERFSGGAAVSASSAPVEVAAGSERVDTPARSRSFGGLSGVGSLPPVDPHP
jgi:hypothetical protein